MADPTPVNGQITDAITQANLSVVGTAPALAMGNLYQACAQAAGQSAQNAVSAQQQGYTVAEAVLSASVSALLGTQK